MNETNVTAFGEEPRDSEAELVIERVFDAPRELVFKAWSEPERLARWWGPKGFTVHVEALDFRPGGLFHYALCSANGQEMWGKFVYGEIVPPEKIGFTTSFSDASGATVRAPFSADFPLEIRNLVTFAEENGKTRLTITGKPVNATEAECTFFAAMRSNMQAGFGGTFDQLESYLIDAAL